MNILAFYRYKKVHLAFLESTGKENRNICRTERKYPSKEKTELAKKIFSSLCEHVQIMLTKQEVTSLFLSRKLKCNEVIFRKKNQIEIKGLITQHRKFLYFLTQRRYCPKKFLEF